MSFKIFQVLDDNAALVHGGDGYESILGTVYLLIEREGKYYYDEEVIKVPEGKKSDRLEYTAIKHSLNLKKLYQSYRF